MRKTSRHLRAKLAAKQKRTKTPMVKHTVSKSGKNKCRVLRLVTNAIKMIKIPYQIILVSFGVMEPRSGAGGLKKSQAYPRRYGVKLAAQHTKFLVSRMKSDSIGMMTFDIDRSIEIETYYSTFATCCNVGFEARYGDGRPWVLRSALERFDSGNVHDIDGCKAWWLTCCLLFFSALKPPNT